MKRILLSIVILSLILLLLTACGFEYDDFEDEHAVLGKCVSGSACLDHVNKSECDELGGVFIPDQHCPTFSVAEGLSSAGKGDSSFTYNSAKMNKLGERRF